MQQPTAPPPSYDNVAKTQPQPAGYNPQYGTGPSGYNPQPVQVQPAYGAQPNGGQPYGGQPVGAGYAAAGHTIVMGGVGAGITRDPCQMKCTQCGADILTDVKYVNGQSVYCCMLLCILMGCWCGCCLMPFCSPNMKDAEHYCPNCKAQLGTCPGQAGVRVHHQ